MLLNLFLAILLKAITSTNEEGDPEEEEVVQDVANELVAKETDKDKQTEGNEGQIQEEPKAIAPAAPDACNDSNIINSSNSNIDEEFAQIRD